MHGARSAVAKLLQEQREQAGLSRAKLGELLEVSPGTIEGWELGRVTRPPLHDVIRIAEYMGISYRDLLAAVTADSGDIPPRRDDSSGALRTARRRTKAVGAIRLLEASFRLFRWDDDDDAAAALSVSPDQVCRWRQGAEPMNLVDYLSLTAMVNMGIADAMRSDEESDLDLRGAFESLGLRIA